LSYNVKYNSTLRLIELVPAGTLTSEDIRHGTDELIALHLEHDANRVLIDASEVESVEHLIDFFDQPRRYDEGGVSRSIHIGLVMAKKIDAQEAIRFYDNVCFNRGWAIQQFETRDAALEWLTSLEFD
jgi:hypothetical protein